MAAKIKVEKTITTRRSLNVTLTNEELVNVLKEAGVIPAEIPEFRVSVQPIPNDFDIDITEGVELRWEETTVEHE